MTDPLNVQVNWTAPAQPNGIIQFYVITVGPQNAEYRTLSKEDR